jgi:hypothetical protein
MIDIWFKNDLQSIFNHHAVAVFIDESGEAEFLLRTVENEVTIYHADSEVEELHVKYLIEKAQPSNEKFLIYTHSKKDNLKFIREYCETNGCVEIRYFQNYIKDKFYQTFNLNINLSKDELIAAAKVSVGKDSMYWLNLSHKGATEIFNLEKELLPFVHDPDTYSKKIYDAQLRELFYRKVNDLLDQEYINKPAVTVAREVVNAMFNGLANGNCNKILESVYMIWLDSISYRDSFSGYLKNYSLPTGIDVWSISINHPFRQVDERWLNEIGKSLSDKSTLSNIIPRLHQRNQSKQAYAIGIFFWNDVITLLEFDFKNITYLNSFNECVEFYKKYFCKLDTAIRNLYGEFLNKRELLEPFQELYKELVSIFLHKWFSYFSEYKEEQTGLIQRIFDENEGIKTAIIVGDGVAYEIAEQVVEKVKGSVNIRRGSILADFPSETENNLSQIYVGNGITEAIQSNREKYLISQNPDMTIDFANLTDVTEDARPGQYLICTYKDIDNMGEKLQQNALKYFPEIIKFFADKISLLLRSGYEKVYLITDHGFVLTGLLSEADKISVSLKGEYNIYERYIRSENQQAEMKLDFIEIEKHYKYFKYLYFAKNINPFKTPGLYGYSHGGVTPQELITPYFCWERSGDSIESLSVIIENKADLQDVTGELFSIKMLADKGENDLFTLLRKVYLVFFANKKQVYKSDIFTIHRDERIIREYAFDGHPEIEIHLLDATTKQQLDQIAVKQNKDRDLGGLL